LGSPAFQWMMTEQKISVIVPAFNEEKSLSDVLSKLKGLETIDEIIVVDDGSRDNTAQVAQDLGARIISHPYNMGNGAAVKTGVRNATGDVLLFLDGDGQHSPEDIPKLLAHIDRFDMVVGARTKESKVSLFRSFGNFWLTKVANYLSGTKIPDLTSGFRAIKRERMLEFLHLLPNKYSYPTTITLALLQSGYWVKYVPLSNIQKRHAGNSGVKPFKDGLRFILIIMRIVMLFSPQKIFSPASFLMVFGGILLIGYNIVKTGGIQESTIILMIVGVFTFFFGLLADQMAHIRREIQRRVNR